MDDDDFGHEELIEDALQDDHQYEAQTPATAQDEQPATSEPQTADNKSSTPRAKKKERIDFSKFLKKSREAAPEPAQQQRPQQRYAPSNQLASQASARKHGSRYFIMRSHNAENIQRSIENGVWATQSHNEAKLDQAFRTAEAVYLIYSINGTGCFQGYAKMTTGIGKFDATLMWQGFSNSRSNFGVEWQQVLDVPYDPFKHLTNPLNENKPVSQARDGQEVPPGIGDQMLRIINQAAVHQGALPPPAPQRHHMQQHQPPPPPGAAPSRGGMGVMGDVRLGAGMDSMGGMGIGRGGMMMGPAAGWMGAGMMGHGGMMGPGGMMGHGMMAGGMMNRAMMSGNMAVAAMAAGMGLMPGMVSSYQATQQLAAAKAQQTAGQTTAAGAALGLGMGTQPEGDGPAAVTGRAGRDRSPGLRSRSRSRSRSPRRASRSVQAARSPSPKPRKEELPSLTDMSYDKYLEYYRQVQQEVKAIMAKKQGGSESGAADGAGTAAAITGTASGMLDETALVRQAMLQGQVPPMFPAMSMGMPGMNPAVAQMMMANMGMGAGMGMGMGMM